MINEQDRMSLFYPSEVFFTFLCKTDINVEDGADWMDEWQFKIQVSKRVPETLMEDDPTVTR